MPNLTGYVNYMKTILIITVLTSARKKKAKLSAARNEHIVNTVIQHVQQSRQAQGQMVSLLEI